MIVLIVEDSPAIVEIWRRLLVSIGKEFRVAENIAAALEEMTKPPLPDLVLLDLRLPGSTPEQTLAQIDNFKAVNPGVVVLVVTGNPDQDLPALAAQFGADGFAHKKDVVSQDRLLSEVKRAFQKSEESAATPKYERRMQLYEKLNAMVTPGGQATA